MQMTGSCPSRRTTSSSRAADVVVGFADQDPCHEPTSPTDAGITPPGWYEDGMNARPRILVVDDDEDIRLLLRELLERAGYTVDEAPDGRTALRNSVYERRRRS